VCGTLFVVDSAEGLGHLLFDLGYDGRSVAVVSIAVLERGPQREWAETYMMTTSMNA
jgi:hypothetical protein